MSNKDKILLAVSILMFLISGVFLYLNFYAPQYIAFLPEPAGPSAATTGLTQAQVIENKAQGSYRRLDGPNSNWQTLWNDPRFIRLSDQAMIPVEVRSDEYGQKENPFMPLQFALPNEENDGQ